jgi:peptide/nickel transport system substrate-binding protein
MTVVDPTTLQVTLKAPNLNFNHEVAQKIAWIASPTALQSEGSNYGTHPVGAGPFLLTSWTPNSQSTLTRNPNYWQAGQPYLDTVIVKILLDQNQMYNTLKTGGGNVMTVVSLPMFPAQAEKDGLNTVLMDALGGGFTFGFNNAKPPFNDPRVRKAIDLAIDRDHLNQVTRSGSPATLITTLDRQGTTYYDPNIGVPKTDLAAAQKLIDQVVAETGKPIEFTFTSFNAPNLVTDSQELQAQISKLKNVTMKLDVLASTQVVQAYTTGNYQATQLGLTWNVPAIDMARLFSSTSPFNYTHYSNPQVDAALKQLAATTDKQTQVQLVQSIEKQVLNDAPVAWYTRTPYWQIYDKSVQNYQNAFDHIPLLNAVWLSS